jgi:hypothetical protein
MVISLVTADQQRSELVVAAGFVKIGYAGMPAAEQAMKEIVLPREALPTQAQGSSALDSERTEKGSLRARWKLSGMKHGSDMVVNGFKICSGLPSTP